MAAKPLKMPTNSARMITKVRSPTYFSRQDRNDRNILSIFESGFCGFIAIAFVLSLTLFVQMPRPVITVLTVWKSILRSTPIETFSRYSRS